jgi:hypothetical protein
MHTVDLVFKFEHFATRGPQIIRTFYDESVFTSSDFPSVFGVVVDKHVFRGNGNPALLDGMN